MGATVDRGMGGVGGKVGRGWGVEQEEEGVLEGWWDWHTLCKVSCWGHADFLFSKERCCIMSMFLLRRLLSNKDRESIFEKNNFAGVVFKACLCCQI